MNKKASKKGGEYVNVQVDNRVSEALKALKEATGARSLSEVIEQVLIEHRPEAIKAAEDRMEATNVLKAKIKGQS